MTLEFENLIYADVFYPLPYPVREVEKKSFQRIKIPCVNIHHAFLMFEILTALDTSKIQSVELFNLNKVKGNTRYDFQHFRTFQDSELTRYIQGYKRNVKKKLLNSII